MIFVATKNGREKKNFPLLLWCCFYWIWDQGSEIRDPGCLSRIRITAQKRQYSSLLLID